MTILINRPIVTLPLDIIGINEVDSGHELVISISNKGDLPAFNLSIMVHLDPRKNFENFELTIGNIRQTIAPGEKLKIHEKLNLTSGDDIEFKDKKIKTLTLNDGSTLTQTIYIHVLVSYTSTSSKNGFKPPYYNFLSTIQFDLDTGKFFPIGSKEIILDQPLSDKTYLIINPPHDYRISSKKFDIKKTIK